MALVESWNIRLAADAEKVREVFRRIKKTTKAIGDDSAKKMYMTKKL